MGKATIHPIEEFRASIGKDCWYGCGKKAEFVVDRKLPGGFGSHIEVCEDHVKKYQSSRSERKETGMSAAANMVKEKEPTTKLSIDDRVMFIKKIVKRIANDYIIRTTEDWEKLGYESPEQAVKDAVGQGGSYGGGVSCDNIQTYQKGFLCRIEDREGDEITREGIITYKELADYILSGEIKAQMTLF